MLDIAAIQTMAHTLIQSLTGFDSKRIVEEKSEDGAAIKAAGLAIAGIGDVIERATADGVITKAEIDEAQAAGQHALAMLKAAGAEVVDQTSGGTGGGSA